MLHVILHILAIIGIILLCILGLVLLLILLVLFVPVRYRIKGNRTEDVLQLSVGATYLLHLLSVCFAYPEKGHVIVRLFGIKLYDSGRLIGEESEEEVAARHKKEEKAAKKAAKKAKTESLTETEKTTAESRTEAEQTTAESRTESERVLAEKRTEAAQEDAKPADDSTAEGDAGKPSKKAGAIPVLIAKIKYTIASICDKIKSIRDKVVNIFADISYYKEVLTDPKNTAFFDRAKKRVFRILKSIRPKVLKARLRIGTGSPDTTGYLCGVYGMLSPILGKNVQIQPDFEEKVAEGSFFIKGRITIFTILVQILKVLSDKQLRIFFKELKREE